MSPSSLNSVPDIAINLSYFQTNNRVCNVGYISCDVCTFHVYSDTSSILSDYFSWRRSTTLCLGPEMLDPTLSKRSSGTANDSHLFQHWRATLKVLFCWFCYFSLVLLTNCG